MIVLGTITAVTSILFLLWRRYKTIFTLVQIIQFLEFPLQVYMNHYHPVPAWYMWHMLNKINILLSLVAVADCWGYELWPAGVLLSIQAFLKMFQYAPIDTNWQFTMGFLHQTNKLIDISVNMVVIFVCLTHKGESMHEDHKHHPCPDDGPAPEPPITPDTDPPGNPPPPPPQGH